MKIAYILTALENQGPFIVAKDIIEGIIEKVETIEVFYLKTAQRPLNLNVKTTKINFFQSIDFSKYDLIHSNGFLADFYVSVHLDKKAKWINTLHQKILPNYKMSHNYIMAIVLEHFWLRCLKKANCVVTLTKEMQDYYSPKFKEGLIKYIHNGIPANIKSVVVSGQELLTIKQLKLSKKLIGISARLVYLKGIDKVIEALALTENYSLLLIGDGEEKDNLLDLAKKLNVDDRCFFLGYKSNPRDYLKLCDLYVMSSRTEGFGLCVIEAASQKLPVLCNDLPVYRELFIDEVVRFRLEDITSLIKALDYAVENTDTLAEKIYDKFIKSFTSEVMANNYLNLYNSLCINDNLEK